MKVVISAYACEPGFGSEPGAGWAWTRAAAQAGNEVWVVTRENNRKNIEAALVAEPDLNVTPVYLDLPRRLRAWKRGQRGVRPYYALWQHLARRRISELHAAHSFDVAHHLTFAVDWLPAGAVGVSGLPSVWGPVGGAGSIPARLYPWVGVRGVAQEVMREVVVRSCRRWYGDRSARAAGIVVAQNDDVARRFARTARRVVVEPNVALPDSVAPDPIQREPGALDTQGHTALFVGRLIPLKGLRLAIAALAALPENWSLDVLGDGPERARCERFAAKLGVQSRVRFEGKVAREEVLARMSKADVMVLPSMHDSAGWVVGEAVTVGTPVACLDLGGPATMIRRGGGLAVSARGKVIEELARAIEFAAATEVPGSPWRADRLPALLEDWYGYVCANG